MIALDTCVIARLLVGDDEMQREHAAGLIRKNDCSVSWTVLVELCWVLERSMKLGRDLTVSALAQLADIDRLTVPDTDGLNWCIARYREGSDFADMVHLWAALPGSTALATFDRRLRNQADPPLPVRSVED